MLGCSGKNPGIAIFLFQFLVRRYGFGHEYPRENICFCCDDHERCVHELCYCNFSSHTNWQEESKRLATELEQSQAERLAKESELTTLNEQIVASEKDREQVVAKLETALQQKDGELATLKKNRDATISKLDEDIKELAEAKDERDAAEKTRE